MIKIVFTDKWGDIKWDDVREVESLESFAEKMNKRVMQIGSKRPTHWIDSPHMITVTSIEGKLNGTWHVV
ncbi:MAG: hypothetical protein WDM76_11005 [Limisphaerales bacterium]